MIKIDVSAFDLAQRYIGVKEIPGVMSNPVIMAMLRLDNPSESWITGDEIPWCSAFVNYVAWLLRLPRSKSLAARSWLSVGIPVPLGKAEAGFDVVVLSRQSASNAAAGHVGFFAGRSAIADVSSLADTHQRFAGTVEILGGNQSDGVNIATFPADRVLSVRRLYGG